MSLAAAFAFALLLSLVFTPAAVRLAWTLGWLDHPEARKLHTSATAVLGGAAVFVAAFVAWFVAHRVPGVAPDRQAITLLAGSVVVLALGLWDDRFGMQPAPKLLGQAAAGAIVLASGALPDLGIPAWAAWALCLVVLVALMNAVNFLDNMNGMVAGMSAIALAAFAWHSAARGAYGVAAAQLAVSGALVGFLPYNFPRARIFLGDAGSLFLGYSLGASAVLAFVNAPAGWGRVGPLLMLAYPAFDMIFVVVNRLREGRKVYEGGKDHTNHRLASVLRCPIRTVILLWCVTAALCASGLAVLWLNRPTPALLASVLWTSLLLPSGLRLSSVPVSRPSPVPPAT
uniref:Undecaprenyl/decaprenyl-phosphate alpha-N-acetylglucosaminyl 1-phosphate transferase n=1 Tax=Eiseniibacteriota bacterium TaxID=2212470 RepID=A0A832I5V3_UNCEI